MNRRAFLSGAAAAPAASAAAGGQVKEQPACRFPNILLVWFDQCRTDTLGAHDECKVPTPYGDGSVCPRFHRFQSSMTQ
jgi:hypothetical protein